MNGEFDFCLGFNFGTNFEFEVLKFIREILMAELRMANSNVDEIGRKIILYSEEKKRNRNKNDKNNGDFLKRYF